MGLASLAGPINDTAADSRHNSAGGLCGLVDLLAGLSIRYYKKKKSGKKVKKAESLIKKEYLIETPKDFLYF
jgi:hypothetical protein